MPSGSSKGGEVLAAKLIQFPDRRGERYADLQNRIIDVLNQIGYRLRDLDTACAPLHVTAWMMKNAGFDRAAFDALARHVGSDVWSDSDDGTDSESCADNDNSSQPA